MRRALLTTACSVAVAATSVASLNAAGDASQLAFTSLTHQSEVHTIKSDGTSDKRLTNDPAPSRWAAPSPDGTQVALARASADGSWRVGIIGLDGAVVRWLPTDGWAGFPDWSPDGTRIVYSTGPQGTPALHLVVFDLVSGSLSRITSGSLGDTSPRWSPDGTRIAFARGNPDEIQIYTVAPDGTSLRQITHGAGGNGPYRDTPSWSPDGTRLVYQDGNAIGFSNADGTAASILPRLDGEVDFSPDWGAAGVAYIAWSGDTFAIKVGGSLAKPARTVVRTAAIDVRWSHDGSGLVYTTAADEGAIVATAGAGGAAYRSLTTGPADGAPAWSPDRGRLAFTRDPYADPSIWTVRSDGSGLARITPAGSADADPAWSPDGRTIAFAHRGAAKDRQLWLMNADGTKRRLAYASKPAILGYVGPPSWSPDGKQIAFAEGAPTYPTTRLFVETLATRRVRVIVTVRAGLAIGRVAWSPDSKLIAFDGRNDQYETEIYVVGAKGGARRRLTSGGAVYDAFAPTWSPDGSEVAFLRFEERFTYSSSIAVVPRTGGSARVLVREPWSVLDPAWAR